MTLLKSREEATRNTSPVLVLIDNLGVATSSLNALAFTKTVVERLTTIAQES